MRTVRPFQKFGELLRDARTARRMKQEELAARLEIGQQAVSNWERGTSRPKTKALLLRLAGMFPEHEPALWRELAGYRETSREVTTLARLRPVRPLLETLPLDRLSFQQFQNFSALLLEFVYAGKACVNAFGVEGDAQHGIDLEARFLNGRYETFQCKREQKFGPEKVRRAMREHKIKCDRAVILLSRKATVAARKAIPRSGKWELWDAEDIARMIRALSLAKKKRIVDTFFPAYRKDFLGIDDVGALETPEEHFAPLLQRDHVFSHAWTLAGREQDLERLVVLTSRAPKEVTLVLGSGGIGKSRLVRAFVDVYRKSQPDHGVFMLSADRVLSASDLDLLAEQPSLLIIEDGHEHANIGALFSVLARLERPVRLLVTARLYAAQIIRSEASRNGLRVDEDGIVTLRALTLDQAENLAHEILADRKGPEGLARNIAQLTLGSSLALVVGSYLVATARIHPRILNNSQRFRDQLFRQFRDALTGKIGPESERESIRDTLNLVALCQPIDTDSPPLKSLAEGVLHLPIDKVKRAIQLLHDAGVLVRRGRMFRIIPDLLAEYILEETCVLRATGGSSGYVERVIALCDEGQLATILLNVSKLDWRLSVSEADQSRLADSVWQHIGIAYDQTPTGQRAIVEAVTRAAYYQPVRALHFYDRLREGGHSPGELAPLLKHAAMNVEHVEAAARRLWELGRGDQRPLNSYPTHPVRIFHELASIEPMKPIAYCERIVRFAMQLIEDGQGGAGEHSAFGALQAALATEGHTTESHGYSITMRGFGVRRDGVASLRQTIIDFLFQHLTSSDLRIAILAAGTLAYALKSPHGVSGRIPSDEERSSWTGEFIETLRKIRRVVEGANLDPFVTVQLQRSVNWHAEYAGPPTQEEARSVLRAIRRTVEWQVSLALVDAWGHLKLEGADDGQSAARMWQEEHRRIAGNLVSAFPNTVQTIEFLRERLRLLRSVKRESSSPGVFVGVLVESYPKIAGAICEAVISNPEDPIRDVFGEALVRLAMTEPKRALAVAETALCLGDVGIVRSVSAAYAVRLRSQDGVLVEERRLAERLVQRDDDVTVRAIITGIASQITANRSWTLATLLAAPLERSPDTADLIFSTFTRSGDLPLEALGDSTVNAFIDKLVACPSIESYWIQEFLSAASRTTPSRVVRLLIERIDRAAESTAWGFEAMPYLWDEQPRLKVRETADHARQLKTVREWLLSAPRNWATDFWGPKLYAAIAGGYDEVVLMDLDVWAKSGNADELSVVARILSEAPRGFVFERCAFVEELLEHAATVGQKCFDRVLASLLGSAISGMRHGAPGRPYPEDETRRDRSVEALARLSPSSPAWVLFDGLKRDAERDIRRESQEDEELFEE